MYFRMNKRFKKLVKKVSKQVATRLEVDKVILCVEPLLYCKTYATTLICFETSVDNVYAALQTDEDNLLKVLEGFLNNPEVEWACSE